LYPEIVGQWISIGEKLQPLGVDLIGASSGALKIQ
jgi:hypothetical protein